MKDTKNAIKESIEVYFAFCAQRGEIPDKPFSGSFTVRLSPEQHQKIILAAENSGKDVNSWISDVLTQAAS